jgi:hypothetical protein
MAVIAVLVNRTAWGSAEPHTKKAPGAVVTTESATTQPSDRLTFTPVVQRSLPVGPDYRGAISFVTGTAPWWPKAAWIHAPRSEDIERQVGQWLEVHKIDASGDENCGLVGHGLVAAEMKAAFVDVTPEMIVKATHGLDPKSHGLSAREQPVRFPLVFAFGTRGGNLGVLEIRGFSDDRKLVKLRYKLVRPDDRGRIATRPPPALPPAEIQRETIDETIHKLFALAAAGSPAAQPVGRPTAAHLERIAEDPRVAAILNGIRDGSAAKQDAIRAAILRECQRQEEPTWCNAPAGSVAAYAWQSALDRMTADPQGQAPLKAEQAAVLRAYQQYREATKAQGEFLYPSEAMRFATEFVTAGQPPAPHEAEKVEQPAFDSLSIEVSGFWPGRRTITIQGGGKYAFDMKDYRAAYQLKPEHVRQLSELLKATDWLTMAAGRAMATDVTTYTLTLDRDGRKTKVAAEDIQQGPYKELIRFVRRIERQETLLHQATNPSSRLGLRPDPLGDQQNVAAHELRSELGASASKPLVMPYAPVLDYHRLVPVFTQWLAKPRGRSYDAVATAAELVAFLKIESQRSNLEAAARGRLPDHPADKIPRQGRVAAVLALGRLGAGRSLSVLESLQADGDPFVRGAVADALLTAPPAAIPILQEMAAESRPAAWALIRLGDKAESAIVEILTEPTFRSSGPGHVIREYYEHWKELPAPPSAAIVKAIRYRVQADAKDGPFDKYGLDVLKLAGAPLEEVKR